MKAKIVVTLIVVALLAFLLFIALRDEIPTRPLKTLPEADKIVIREYPQGNTSYVDYEITDPETVENVRTTLAALKMQKVIIHGKQKPLCLLYQVVFYNGNSVIKTFEVVAVNEILIGSVNRSRYRIVGDFQIVTYLRSLLPEDAGE
ncbi:MAG: hypothetical protein IK090_07015 [Clostridia bacterium]|nr:hypothetical protein [Clostridia bacterium]